MVMQTAAALRNVALSAPGLYLRLWFITSARLSELVMSDQGFSRVTVC